MGLGSILNNSHRDEEGLLKRQTLNGYTMLIIVTLGLGSLTYGYTASIIGTTLGAQYLDLIQQADTDMYRATVIH